MGVKVRSRGNNNAWWIFVDHAGHRKAKKIGTGKRGKELAEAAAVKIQARLLDGDLGIFESRPAPVTFKDYAERWMTGVAALRCQPGTIEEYRRRLDLRLLPSLGALPLTAITREKVKAFVAEQVQAGHRRSKGAKIAPGTVKGFMRVLVAILNAALDDGLIASNPASRWGHVVRIDQQQAEEVEVFTPSELAALLAVAKADYPDMYPMILTLSRTGCRLGEAIALRWEDVAFTERRILIRRSVRHGKTKAPKNGKARRVDMSRQLAEVLQGWQSLQEAEAVVAGQEPSPWVFPALATWSGAAEHLRHVWRLVLRRAGLRYRKPHSLRHTFASTLIHNGELGHHSAAFTLEIYGHFIPQGDRRAVDALDGDAATTRNPGATKREGEMATRS
jgi:integrase